MARFACIELQISVIHSNSQFPGCNRYAINVKVMTYINKHISNVAESSIKSESKEKKWEPPGN